RDALLLALPASTRGVLRPVDPALMHVTLRFHGEVDERALAAPEVSLAEGVPPVDLSLAPARPAPLGAPERPAVAGGGIEGHLDGLRALAGRVEAAVRAAGLPPEDRAFSPHLTLARVRRDASAEERRAIAAAAQSLAPCDAKATAIHVRKVVLV